jgi:hypothetical protein
LWWLAFLCLVKNEKCESKSNANKKVLQNTALLFNSNQPILSMAFHWPSNADDRLYVAAVMYAIKQLPRSTMLFYDLVIRPIKWLFPLNITNGQLLMIIITILHYSMLDINHEPIFGEMTRICYLVRLFLKKFRTYFGKWGLYFY